MKYFYKFLIVFALLSAAAQPAAAACVYKSGNIYLCLSTDPRPVAGEGTRVYETNAADPSIVKLFVYQGAAWKELTDHDNLADKGTNTHAQIDTYLQTPHAQTKTCLSTDKFSAFNAVTGEFTCSVDQTGSGGATPADTVLAETSFGIASSAGIASTYSRGDHTHGTPADPVPAHASITTGVHGVGASTVESSAGAASKVSTHAALTTNVHNFDISGRAPAQTHDHTAADGSGVLTNDVHDGYIDIGAITEPVAPGANFGRLYIFDRGGRSVLALKTDAGNVIEYGDDTAIVRNVTGSPMTKGQAVYQVGVNSGLPSVALALATSDATMPIYCVLMEDIANLSNGRCTVIGLMSGLNTLGYSVGDKLFVSHTVAGQLTTAEPPHPNLKQRVGLVMFAHATSGYVYVFPVGVRGDHEGTNRNDWKIGDALAGAKTLQFVASGAAVGTLTMTPTAARTVTIPDATGTLALTSDLHARSHSLDSTSDHSGRLALNQLTDNDVTASLCLVSGGAGGEPNYATCPGGGGGAPTTSKYLLQQADGALPNAQAMGALGTGIVLNTTTTGVQSIYGGTSCTNQFPRSLNASGAATCAAVVDTDISGTISGSKTLALGSFLDSTTYNIGKSTPTGVTLNVGHNGTSALVNTFNIASHTHATSTGTGGQIAYSSLTGQPTLPQNEAGAANNYLSAYNSTTGAWTKSQPAFTNISGTATDGQLPTTISASKVLATGSFADATTYNIGKATPSTVTLNVGHNGTSALVNTFNIASHTHANATGAGGQVAISDTTGTLAVARGGTNATATPTAGAVSYGTGTAYAFSAAGTSGDCLKSGGTGSPTWGACAAGGGYATIQDETTPLTQRATVNFAGAGVTCADNAGATRTDCTIPGGGADPDWYGQIYAAYGRCDPQQLLRMATMSGTVSATPTNITTSVARIAYFRPPANITVNKIRFYGGAASTNVYRTAIYDGDTLARLTAELPITTVANTWGSVGSGLNLTLVKDQLYFIAVSVNATGTQTGMLCVSPTIGAATGQIAVLPKTWPGNLNIDLGYIDGAFAQFAVTTGALPATAPTIAVQTNWTGGFPLFFLDNNNN